MVKTNSPDRELDGFEAAELESSEAPMNAAVVGAGLVLIGIGLFC